MPEKQCTWNVFIADKNDKSEPKKRQEMQITLPEDQHPRDFAAKHWEHLEYLGEELLYPKPIPPEPKVVESR